MEAVNYNLDELHIVQLNMLKKLIAVCAEHGFCYFLGFGSLLGAVRNHGIIAWDDSIDIVMPYGDYAKLTVLPQETWGGDLFLQTYDTDPEYPNCYAKLRDSRTTLIKADYADLDINHGIYINIMPLVNLADHPEERRRQIRDAKLYKALAERKAARMDSTALRICASFLIGTSSERRRVRIRERLKEKVLRFEGEDTKDCFVLAGNVSLTLPLSRTWFASAAEGEFEGIKVNFPKGWNEWLTLRYGDYMVAPISELQGDKISDFVALSTDKPFTEYKGITYCVK